MGNEMKVVCVEECQRKHKWSNYDLCVTLERSDGKRFSINIPDNRWIKEDAPQPHGLNLVYGDGDHYL